MENFGLTTGKLDAHDQIKQVPYVSKCEKVIRAKTNFLATTPDSKVCTAFSANRQQLKVWQLAIILQFLTWWNLVKAGDCAYYYTAVTHKLFPYF